MSISAKYLPNYTYKDYLQWEGRWEIIQGIPHAMSPMPSPRHQKISIKLSTLFDLALQNNQCHCSVYNPIDLKVSEHTVFNPDLLIVCKEIIKQYLDFPPDLVVEILSPSTELKDRNSKYEIYESFGIKYYLIVDPRTNAIELFELNSLNRYERSDHTKDLTIGKGCQIKVPFEDIWN